MTLWACGTFTYAARLRENCVKCGGKGCLCCADKGTHAERGAQFQKDNINARFVANQSVWMRPGRQEKV